MLLPFFCFIFPQSWLLSRIFCLIHVMLIWYCWKLDFCFLWQWRWFIFLVYNKISPQVLISIYDMLETFHSFSFSFEDKEEEDGQACPKWGLFQNEVSRTWITYVQKFNLLTQSGKAFSLAICANNDLVHFFCYKDLSCCSIYMIAYLSENVTNPLHTCNLRCQRPLLT